MIQPQKFVLLIGATGKTGFHVANFLIQKRFPVRLIVRSKASVSKLFGQKQVAFQSIRECPDITTPDGIQFLKSAFQQSSTYGKITHVISSLGANSGGKQNVQKIQYDYQRLLIDTAKQFNIQRYVLVTAALITKPWHIVPLFLNLLLSNVYAYKSKAQNYLRNSGLSYTIVRPGGLKGSFDMAQTTNYTISQGDVSNPSVITRATVARIIVDTLACEQLKSKVTFECGSTKAQLKEPYVDPTDKVIQLSADTQKDIVKANHARSSAVVKFLLLSLLIFGVSRLLN